jgi:hypothetical protein
LVNIDHYNWPSHFRGLLNIFRPQLSIVMLGADDEHAIDVGGVSAHFGSTLWQQAYEKKIRQMAMLVRREKGYALWVGLPVMQDSRYSNGAALINSLIRYVALTTPGMKFLPTTSVLATPAGRYIESANVNGSSARLRAVDGIHILPVGADVLATYIVNQIAQEYHVRLRPAAPAFITPR